MRRILVVGFGPFPGCPNNPSEVLAHRLQGRRCKGQIIVSAVVPVSWCRAWPSLRSAIDAARPHVLVMTGVAGGEVLRLEEVARNKVGTLVDVDGQSIAEATSRRITEDGRMELVTTLPVARIHQQLAATGLLMPSVDAGDYLCNYLFYLAMACDTSIAYKGFVHIPAFDRLPLQCSEEIVEKVAFISGEDLDLAP